MTEICNPSFVGRPQRHIDFAARTAFDFAPRNDTECAGLALLQNHDNHFRFVRQGADIVLSERKGGEERVLGAVPAAGEKHYLKVEARGQAYSFYYAAFPETWIPIAENASGRVLSTQVAGGFVGTHIGLYASSNGQPSESAALL